MPRARANVKAPNPMRPTVWAARLAAVLATSLVAIYFVFSAAPPQLKTGGSLAHSLWAGAVSDLGVPAGWCGGSWSSVPTAADSDVTAFVRLAEVAPRTAQLPAPEPSAVPSRIAVLACSVKPVVLVAELPMTGHAALGGSPIDLAVIEQNAVAVTLFSDLEQLHDVAARLGGAPEGASVDQRLPGVTGRGAAAIDARVERGHAEESGRCGTSSSCLSAVFSSGTRSKPDAAALGAILDRAASRAAALALSARMPARPSDADLSPPSLPGVVVPTVVTPAGGVATSVEDADACFRGLLWREGVASLSKPTATVSAGSCEVGRSDDPLDPEGALIRGVFGVSRDDGAGGVRSDVLVVTSTTEIPLKRARSLAAASAGRGLRGDAAAPESDWEAALLRVAASPARVAAAGGWTVLGSAVQIVEVRIGDVAREAAEAEADHAAAVAKAKLIDEAARAKEEAEAKQAVPAGARGPGRRLLSLVPEAGPAEPEDAVLVLVRTVLSWGTARADAVAHGGVTATLGHVLEGPHMQGGSEHEGVPDEALGRWPRSVMRPDQAGVCGGSVGCGARACQLARDAGRAAASAVAAGACAWPNNPEDVVVPPVSGPGGADLLSGLVHAPASMGACDAVGVALSPSLASHSPECGSEDLPTGAGAPSPSGRRALLSVSAMLAEAARGCGKAAAHLVHEHAAELGNGTRGEGLQGGAGAAADLERAAGQVARAGEDWIPPPLSRLTHTLYECAAAGYEDESVRRGVSPSAVRVAGEALRSSAARAAGAVKAAAAAA